MLKKKYSHLLGLFCSSCSSCEHSLEYRWLFFDLHSLKYIIGT